MSMPLLAVPSILNRSACSEVVNAVVQSVSVLVVYHLAPCRYHVVQIRHNLMQGDSKARYIAILVDVPSRPRKLLPGSRINKEFHIISQGFDNSKFSNDMELVFNPRLSDLLIVVAKSTDEVVGHIWQLYKTHYEIFFTCMYPPVPVVLVAATSTVCVQTPSL